MSTLHFRCSFDLTNETAGHPMEMLLKTVRKWISTRPNPGQDDDFWKAWFFHGGQWKSQTHAGIRVLTRYCSGDGTRQKPNCWAAEYEHPCEEFPGRRFWRIHIGVEQFDRSQFHLNFQTLYDMRPGYLGPEPTDPLPSPPGLITTLLRSSCWKCTAGPETLCDSPRILRVGDGNLLKDLVAHAERAYPVVLVSQIYRDKGYALNPTELARLLAGTAVVFQSENSEVDTELEYLFGRRFSCWNGMLRIYMPALNFDRQGDERRHRFILKSEIDSWGRAATIENIVRCIARRSTRPKGVLTPLDVEAVIRQRRLAELRKEQDSTSKDEWIQVLEKDNETLAKDKAKLEVEAAHLEECMEELSDRLRRVECENASLKGNFKQSATIDRAQLDAVLANLAELPNTLLETVHLIGAIHPERIVFTERAVSSAGESKFDDVPRAWRTLWAMATTLYDLHFQRDTKDLPRTFRNETGIELAMTERKLTKQDNKKMAQRKDTFMGQEIDITPHVKFDPDSTRAYFCPFRRDGGNRIVVGYIGHLDTAGTTKRH